MKTEKVHDLLGLQTLINMLLVSILWHSAHPCWVLWMDNMWTLFSFVFPARPNKQWLPREKRQACLFQRQKAGNEQVTGIQCFCKGLRRSPLEASTQSSCWWEWGFTWCWPSPSILLNEHVPQSEVEMGREGPPRLSTSQFPCASPKCECTASCNSSVSNDWSFR